MRHRTIEFVLTAIGDNIRTISGAIVNSSKRRLVPAICFTLVATLVASLGHAEDAPDIRGPDVTIISGDDRTVLEFRQGGVLRMVRVVPKWGKPYYLVPRDQTRGVEDLERAETLLPSWVIVEF